MLSQDTLPLPRSERPPPSSIESQQETLPLPRRTPVPASTRPSLLQRVLTGRAAPSEMHPANPALPPARIAETAMGKRSLVVAGEGGPTVVFESGLGDGKEAWGPVFQAVSQHARVVAYDRAGYGDSDPSTARRDGEQIVQELRALLRAEQLPPPYVLVGHSLGGTLAKLFARMHPEEVAGVVLVDARNSDFAGRARHMGVLRLLYEPPKALYLLARQAIRHELRAAHLTMQQARRAGPFPSVPLIVLTHRRAATHWPKDLGRAWLDSQHSMARLSVLGRIEVCDDSGHHVHRDRPDAVVQAVLSVLEAARYLQARRQR